MSFNFTHVSRNVIQFHSCLPIFCESHSILIHKIRFRVKMLKIQEIELVVSPLREFLEGFHVAGPCLQHRLLMELGGSWADARFDLLSRPAISASLPQALQEVIRKG